MVGDDKLGEFIVKLRGLPWSVTRGPWKKCSNEVNKLLDNPLSDNKGILSFYFLSSVSKWLTSVESMNCPCKSGFCLLNFKRRRYEWEIIVSRCFREE